MRHPNRGRFGLVLAAAAAAVLCFAPAPALSQAAASATPPAPVATPPPPPPLEPAALAKLKAMSDLLKGTPSFSFKAVSDREQPSTSGQMLDFFATSQIVVSRPNMVRIDTKGDLHAASLWYDGKTVTIYSEKTTFYGQTEAPATLDEMVVMLMDRFQVPFPAAGFLLKDPYAKMMEGVKTALDAGTSQVDGVTCRHLAFTEEDASWQVWVEEGTRPLPRRIAVTYTKVEGSPRVVTSLSDWNLSPKIPAGEFAFKAPAGATKVDWKTAK